MMYKLIIYFSVISLSIILSYFKIKFYLKKRYNNKYVNSKTKILEIFILIVLIFIISLQGNNYFGRTLNFLAIVIYCVSTIIAELGVFKANKFKTIVSIVGKVMLISLSVYFLIS